MSREAEVVIPHWNRAAELSRALAALAVQTEPVDITVVDNGSSDGSLEMIARDHPHVRVLALPANLGFGAAVNRGVAAGSARVVICLNNDTVADPFFAERLLEVQASSGAEMVAGCLRSPRGPIESLGVEIDRSLVAFDLWHGEPYERTRREAPAPPLAPSGGAAAYVREALLEVGGFDERLFAYLEDVELGIRMRLAGMGCACAPHAFAFHEHSATLGSGAAAKNRLMGASRGYLLWRHGGGRPLVTRLRGHVIDGVTYAGQAVIDRNTGALRGRVEMRSRLRGLRRPEAHPGLASLPYVERPVSEALRMRLARRRRPASPGRRRRAPAPGGRG
jgi:N-acetylglucosaminyl-diphospho-decaprenol L-rhamnosyltransferase